MPQNTLTQTTHDLTAPQIAQATLLVNEHQHCVRDWMGPNSPLGRIGVIADALAHDPPVTRWYELHHDDHYLQVVDRPLLLLQLLHHAEQLAPRVRTYWWLPSKTAQVAGYQPNPDTEAAICDLLAQHAWGAIAHRGLLLADIARLTERPLLDITVAAPRLVRTGRATPLLPSDRGHMRLSLAR